MSFLGRLGKPKYKGKVGHVPMLNKDGTLIDSGQEPGGGGGSGPLNEYKMFKLTITGFEPLEFELDATGITLDDLPKTFLLMDNYGLTAFPTGYSSDDKSVYYEIVTGEVVMGITITYGESGWSVSDFGTSDILNPLSLSEKLEAGVGVVVDLNEDEDAVEIHLDGDVIETLGRALETPLVPPTEGNHFIVGIDDTGGQENIGIGTGLAIQNGNLVCTVPVVNVDSSLSTTSTNALQNKVTANALTGKQDTITDLTTIRNGASAGATAVQPAQLTSALAGKQDTITDLTTIRNGASAGATAVQPAQLTSALAGKQDTLTAGTGITISNNVISASGGSNHLYQHNISLSGGPGIGVNVTIINTSDTSFTFDSFVNYLQNKTVFCNGYFNNYSEYCIAFSVFAFSGKIKFIGYSTIATPIISSELTPNLTDYVLQIL